MCAIPRVKNAGGRSVVPPGIKLLLHCPSRQINDDDGQRGQIVASPFDQHRCGLLIGSHRNGHGTSVEINLRSGGSDNLICRRYEASIGLGPHAIGEITLRDNGHRS